jgi:hypothetical protein
MLYQATEQDLRLDAGCGVKFQCCSFYCLPSDSFYILLFHSFSRV